MRSEDAPGLELSEQILSGTMRLLVQARRAAPGYAAHGAPLAAEEMAQLLVAAKCHVEVFPFRSGTEARLRLDAWELALRTGGIHEARLRTDSLEGLATEVRSWTTSGAVEALRSFGESLAVSGAVAMATYKAAGAIPELQGPGEVYRSFVGPEISFYGTDVLTRAATLALAWSPRERGAVFFLEGRWSATAPVGETRLPWAPREEEGRSGWTMQAGVALN